MNVDFFIKRPIFTSVCSFIIIIAGLICIPLLPVSKYPELTPPLITVTSNYTGASSEVVETTVTTPLEQAINGVEDMKYMTSQSSNDGSSVIQITFNLGKDKDIAAVDVQNRISSVMGTLPEEVKRTGTTISKKSTSIVVAYGFYTDNDEYTNTFISNYIDKYVSDAVKRIEGVGDATIVGERKYSMRVWLDSNKLAARNLTADDVINAISEQNVQVPAGQIGAPPNFDKQKYQMSIQVQGRLVKPEDFGKIVIKIGEDGSLVKINDIGRVELDSEDYSTVLRFNRKNSVGLLVYQLADANALQVFDDCQEKMEELAKSFPPGLKYKVAFETTSVVEESIEEVIFTLFLSILLVVAVIFLFLQSWRSTLIPVITIPVSLIGTFAILKIFDFSINTLTLFGIVLATGLVVDDAIVVIENIERNMEEKGLSPIKAASVGMKDVTGAVIAATLVLGAVFLPVAAFPGTAGQLYKQFALTIVFSVCISLFNALTLTPALSALLLKKGGTEMGGFMKKVDNIINGTRDKYYSVLKQTVKYKAVVVALFLIMLGATYYLLKTVPTGFVPTEDQGYFITTVQGPEGTSINYTINIIKEIEDIIYSNPEVTDTFAFAGYSFTGNGPNKAAIWTTLKPIKERKEKNQSVSAVIQSIRGKMMALSGALVVPFEPPSISGIGNVGGFQFQLLDFGGHTLDDLSAQAKNFVGEASQSNVLQSVFTGFTANSPQLYITVDRDKAKRLNISISDIFDTFQVFLGSKYVNDFNYLDRVYRVYAQADKAYRDKPSDIKEFYIRSNASEVLTPLSSLVNIKKQFTAQTISHFNLYRSVEIDGANSPGYSSGQAIQEMDKIADNILPTGYSYQWAGISLEELKAGQQGIIIFGLGLLFVFLVLAAQYESLVDPFVIILAVPLAIFGALFAQHIRGLDNDVFCQIGLVMLIGLACKNSILIVEFANHLVDQGKDPLTAVTEAGKVRFRPIMMTSFAFILGIFPLVVASGAGAASRISMGTAVFGGMFVSTFLSLFIVPVLYLVAKDIQIKIHGGLPRKNL
ncbi:MAG: multidrug efflux RND transporter permease subunit [Cyanobacteriota bacterium]